MTRFNQPGVIAAAILMTIAAGEIWPATALAQNSGTGTGSAAAPAGPGGTSGTNSVGQGTSSSNGPGTGAPAANNAGPAGMQSSGAANMGTSGNNSGTAQNGSAGVSSSMNSPLGIGEGNSSNQSGVSSGISSPSNTTNGQVSGSFAPTGGSGLTGGGIPNKNNQAPQVFTLDSAIQAAFGSSSDLQIALTNLQRDRALVSVAADRNLPTINAGGTVTHLDSPISVAFGAQRIPVEPENTQAFDANATLPIDISGSVRAATQAAQLQVMADRFNIDRVRNALILNAQTSYFNVLRAQHQVSVAQSALTDAQTQFKTAQTQFEGGVGQKIDVYRASTQVAQAQQQLLQAQNTFALEQYDFNDVVGRPLYGPVAASDVPGVTAGTTVTENGLPVVGSPDNSIPQFYAPPAAELNQIDLQADITKASHARPELRSDYVNVQAEAKQIAITRDEDAPTLSLAATGDYYPVTDFQTPRHSLGVYTATINIPIFDGNITRDRLRAARDNQKNAETTYESDQTTIELQVRQAYLNLYTTANQITAANSALQQAIAARQLAQVRYANGVGLYLEVTDAEAALTNAENSQVNAVYDYLIARAQYENAVGTPNVNPTL